MRRLSTCGVIRPNEISCLRSETAGRNPVPYFRALALRCSLVDPHRSCRAGATSASFRAGYPSYPRGIHKTRTQVNDTATNFTLVPARIEKVILLHETAQFSSWCFTKTSYLVTTRYKCTSKQKNTQQSLT